MPSREPFLRYSCAVVDAATNHSAPSHACAVAEVACSFAEVAQYRSLRSRPTAQPSGRVWKPTLSPFAEVAPGAEHPGESRSRRRRRRSPNPIRCWCGESRPVARAALVAGCPVRLTDWLGVSSRGRPSVGSRLPTHVSAVAWPGPGACRRGGPGTGSSRRDASLVILGLGITARSRPTIPPPRGNASGCVAAQAPLAEVVPTPFAEVAPDGGAVRASLEADAAGVDLSRVVRCRRPRCRRSGG